MNRAFILSRPLDYWMAILCAGRLNSQGWTAQIMIDLTEWQVQPLGSVCASYNPKGRGMLGNEVAEGIMRGMLDHSQDGDLIAKFDCDIWLSDAASEWLQSGEIARCFKLKRPHRDDLEWGGCWAAKREQVVNALAFENRKCRCPESVLNLIALQNTGGFEMHDSFFATEYFIGDKRSDVSTTPITRKYPRMEIAVALFDTLT